MILRIFLRSSIVYSLECFIIIIIIIYRNTRNHIAIILIIINYFELINSEVINKSEL